MRLFYTLCAVCLISTPSMAEISEIVNAFDNADVIILGEIHDNPTHHETQAKVTQEIQPTAIVFEMFTPEQGKRINEVRAEGENLDQLIQEFTWAESGWPEFYHYGQIVEASETGVIYGASAPIESVKAAISDGAAAVFGESAPLWNLDQKLNTEQQQAREELQFTAHCDALPREMLPGMVEAQRYRDAVLANAALQALNEHGAPVIIITGNGHARKDWAIPALLRIANPDITTMSLGQLETGDDISDIYDKIIFAAPADREDPCLQFRK